MGEDFLTPQGEPPGNPGRAVSFPRETPLTGSSSWPTAQRLHSVYTELSACLGPTGCQVTHSGAPLATRMGHSSTPVGSVLRGGPQGSGEQIDEPLGPEISFFTVTSLLLTWCNLKYAGISFYSLAPFLNAM